MTFRRALLVSLVFVPGLLMGGRCQAQVTIFFDGNGPENGVTESGTTSFSFMGSNWSGGVVRTEGIRPLYASGSFSYEVRSGPAAVRFDDPVESVGFFYVHGFGFASGTATALDGASNVVGVINSRQATSFGDPSNFVTLAPLVPIARVEFSSGVIDNFTFTALRPPTSTPEETPTRASLPTPTPTPTPIPTPSSTPEPPVCFGDCNGDGQVTVDELLRGVTIALGAASLLQCESLDTNLDGQVTVDELIRAVNEALNGCGSVLAPAFLVKDIFPGPASSNADDGDSGRELWAVSLRREADGSPQ